MKNCMKFTFALILLFFGCLNSRTVQQNASMPEINPDSALFNYWLDKETGTVHKIAEQNGKETILSIIKYRKGIPLEDMKLTFSDSVNGHLHWIYSVPSTGYTVELTEVSKNKNSIDVEWKNKNDKGEEDSGNDILIRCDENGFINDSESIIEEEELPEDFSAFEGVD